MTILQLQTMRRLLLGILAIVEAELTARGALRDTARATMVHYRQEEPR